MPRYAGFIGGTQVHRSLNVNAERTINFYPELTQPGNAKSPIVLLGTPGLRVFADAGGSPIYGLWAQDGRVFAVAGSSLVEVFADRTTTVRGVVADNGTPATIVSNGVGGFQLMVIAGERLYCYDLRTDELTQISGTPALSVSASPSGSDDGESDFPERVMMGDYIDGYFVVLAGEWQLYISALNDGTTWDVADTAQVSSSSNRILALICDHKEVWLFGSRKSEVWINTGNADFPFGPIQGVFIEFGIWAPFSVARIDNTLFWIGADERGAGKVYRMQGYNPIRISTHAVEYAFGQSSRLTEAIAFTYDEEGHSFYFVYVPDLETSWVYDVAIGLWHERAMWDATFSRWWPHLARCHCFTTWGQHLVGDRQSGTIYQMSLDYLDDELVIDGGL